MEKDTNHQEENYGWGKIGQDGSEFWDDRPLFSGEFVTPRDWGKLVLYPKKFMLYRWVKKAVRQTERKIGSGRRSIRVLDVGCGTGAAVIDFKKLFGRSVEVFGVDVVQLQIDIAKDRLREYGVWSELYWYDGKKLPFSDESIDVIYCSDVLGHVEDVPVWLRELNRVLRQGGSLAMFAESAVGKHAYIRKYLLTHGVNIDPHAQFHISLYAKEELQELLTGSGFVIKKMLSVFWAKFLAHPHEFHAVLKNEKRFFVLRYTSRFFSWLRGKLYPYSVGMGELYGLIEMLTIGRFVQSQGYVILAKKEIITEKLEETEQMKGFRLLPEQEGV